MKNEKIKVLIVDDDKKSQDVLAYHLRSIPDIEILAITSGAEEAYRYLLENTPDLIFLDVEMPDKTGFDLLADISKLKISPGIIFQTAFDKYAIQAIKNSAFDYLLKPIDRAELLEALKKFRNIRHHNNLEEQVEHLINKIKPIEKIRFNNRTGFIMIDPSEIIYCQADWNYTEIWFSKEKKELVTMNIGKVENLLPENMFVKINRSVIINQHFIQELNRKNRILTLRKEDFTFNFKVANSQIKVLQTHNLIGL